MPKQTCIIFGNCQGYVIDWFLAKYSGFHDIYNVHIFANWQLIENGSGLPIQLLRTADLVIYQPLRDVHGCYSTNPSNPNSFMRLLKPGCRTISFPRLHNNAIFPVFKRHRQHSLYYGGLANVPENATRDQILALYDAGTLDFDFTGRAQQNYTISKAKEAICDVKIIDFIYDNMATHKMFLTQDHPTSFVFNEVSRQIADLIGLEYDAVNGALEEENAFGLPDSVYERPSKQYPISQYAMDHYGFTYIDKPDADAHAFYRQNLIEYLQHK